MNLSQELKRRLKGHGWTVLRTTGRHEVWLYPPTHKTITLPSTIVDTSHKRANYLAQIERKERLEPMSTTPLKDTPMPNTFLTKAVPVAQPAPALVPLSAFFAQKRREADLSNRALADLFHAGGAMGISAPSVSNIEAGKRGMTPEEVEVFKAIFSIETEAMVNVIVPWVNTKKVASRDGHKGGFAPKPALAPTPAPVDAPVSVPAPAPAPAHDSVVERAIRILQNPHLHPQDREALIKMLRDEAIKILLGEELAS